LKSLNRSLNEGKVKCSECGSNKIIFANQDFEFDVSNNLVRNNILKSIKENIIVKGEIVEELNGEIFKEQELINKFLNSTTPDEKNYILFKDEILDSTEVDKLVSNLQKEITEIEKLINNNETKITSNKDKQKEILDSILSEMKNLYSKVDEEGLLSFEDLFTKTGATHSGSEGQEYYFCKLLALNNILSHEFPIIIDSFREGELSSKKENLMIEEFLKLKKQVILTSTLKDEEYDSDKYLKLKNVKVIDYSAIEDSKILSPSYVESFIRLLSKFGINE
jgi:hypothetical protein